MREKINVIVQSYICMLVIININSTFKCYTYLHVHKKMISFIAIIADYWTRWKMNEQVYYRMY